MKLNYQSLMLYAVYKFDTSVQYSVSYSVRAGSDAHRWLVAAAIVDQTAVEICEHMTTWKWLLTMYFLYAWYLISSDSGKF